MTLKDIQPLPEFFGRYMLLAEDVTPIKAMEIAGQEARTSDLPTWKQLGDRVYATGKWTIKTILQHIIDTERIFLYRALAYARGEKVKVPGFDENEYAQNAIVDHRTLEDLSEELIHTHESAKYLFQSFPESVLHYTCQGFAGEYTVGSIPYILLGHQRWHVKVIEERYLPLLGK
jgi:hypothetical protein